jgi:hypothetical protein
MHQWTGLKQQCRFRLRDVCDHHNISSFLDDRHGREAVTLTDAIPHLCGMGRAKRLKRMVVVFTAFFDDSGTDRKNNKAFVMGGFLGRVEEWLEASNAWEQCLHEHPRIEYFKYSEFGPLSGQFCTFNRQQADNKIISLANTVARFNLHGFCAIVPQGLIKNKPRNKKLVGSRVYDWGFTGVIKIVLQYMRSQPAHEKVDFVFDDRSELWVNIEIFNKIKTQLIFDETMSHAGACVPGMDTQVDALQMASLLAGELLNAEETRGQSEALKIITDKNKITYLHCNARC